MVRLGNWGVTRSFPPLEWIGKPIWSIRDRMRKIQSMSSQIPTQIVAKQEKYNAFSVRKLLFADHTSWTCSPLCYALLWLDLKCPRMENQHILQDTYSLVLETIPALAKMNVDRTVTFKNRPFIFYISFYIFLFLIGFCLHIAFA